MIRLTKRFSSNAVKDPKPEEKSALQSPPQSPQLKTEEKPNSRTGSLTQLLSFKRTSGASAKLSLEMDLSNDDGPSAPKKSAEEEDSYLMLMESGLFGIQEEKENGGSTAQQNKAKKQLPQSPQHSYVTDDVDSFLWASGAPLAS